VGTVSLAADATLTYAWLGFTQAPLDGTVHRVAVARGSVRPSERALAPDLARRGPAEVLLRRLGYGTPWRKVD
jgi:hypothetical protein